MTDTGEFEELAAKAARVQRSLQQVRGRAVSAGGEVRISVGVDGRIHEIDLAPWLFEIGNAQIDNPQMDNAASARMIADTHLDALRDAESIAVDIRRELLDDPRVARVVDRVAAAPVPKVTEANDDGYFARGSFLDRA